MGDTGKRADEIIEETMKEIYDDLNSSDAFKETDDDYEDSQEEEIDIAWVPGAFEIPIIAQKMATSNKYEAIICLGTVIRGSTSHYDFVCNEVSKGIAHVSLNSNIPVMFGVLTTENIEQAIERAGTKAGNKGFEVAVGAIEMVDLMRKIG